MRGILILFNFARGWREKLSVGLALLARDT